MKHKRTLVIATLILGLGLGTTGVLAASASPVSADAALEFDELSLTFEINSDPDAGVLLFADTSESLHRLMVIGPSDMPMFELVSRDRLELGLTEIFWETAEPDVTSAFLAYPEGDYNVIAVAHDGQVVAGVATVSHEIRPYPVVTSPVEGEELPLEDLTVEWDLDPEADSYWIEFDVETEDEEYNYTIPMPAGATSFKLPACLLLPGAEVAAGVGVIGENGNVTVTIVEVTIADD